MVTLDDVRARLGSGVEFDEERAYGLIEEATVLVDAYVGGLPEPCPTVARVVISRMVARVLLAPENVPYGASSEQTTAGVFSRSVSYAQGTTTGGPWLSAADKVALRGLRGGRGGVYSMTLG